MYHRTALPTMPSESRRGFPASHPNEFVDHQQADEVISRWKAKKWEEKIFFGEDFAGRDDTSSLLQRHDPQARETIGAFYRPIPQAAQTVTPIANDPSAISENSASSSHQEPARFYRYAAVAALVLIFGTISAFLTQSGTKSIHQEQRQGSPSETAPNPQTAAVTPSNLPDETMLAKETNLPSQP
jgi:hypothetical protein